MDVKQAETIFENLYGDVNGYTVSSQGRKKLATYDKSFTYGEVTPAAFSNILSQVKPDKKEVFYDLGSGTGKAVFLASMFYNFRKSAGIELVDDLWKTARSVLARFDHEVKPHLHQHDGAIEFIHGDFTRIDFSEADIVFTHSTCFNDSLLLQLEKKMASLRRGSRVITVTKTLVSDHFEYLTSREENMGWGKATVYFYRKI